MTSDEARRLELLLVAGQEAAVHFRGRMLDAEDDAVIIPAEQVAVMEDLLTTLYERRTALDTEIAQMHAKLHASGEARLRKACRARTW